MIAIPKFSSLRVAQDVGKPTRKTIDTLDHVLVVAPNTADDAVFRGLPLQKQLIGLHARARQHPSKQATTRLTNERATGISVAVTKAKSTFEQLTWARATLVRCLNNDGGKLGIAVLGFDADARTELLRALVAAAEASAFALAKFKSKRPRRQHVWHTVRLLALANRLDLEVTRATAYGNNLARWLTAMPPNKLPAAEFMRTVTAIAEEHGVEHELIDEAELQRRNAGAFLAVSQGNTERDAGILHLRYRPKRAANQSIALVGKGVLFDTGGTNLKPFKAMLDMHMDMQGSAVALGTLIALAELEAPFAVDAWLAVTENRISSRSYKSQDIVTASNGTTIQVVHTDAEGRMVLADTLVLASEGKPDLVIDYATLTGSCVTALTDRYSGVFSNREAANEIMIAAGRVSGERVWPFPIDSDFEEPLRSDIADIKQCAVEGTGDHILAARFLSRFVPAAIPWIHIDLSSGQRKGGLAHIPTEFTGFGVRLTVELLLRQLEPGNIAARLKP